MPKTKEDTRSSFPYGHILLNFFAFVLIFSLCRQYFLLNLLNLHSPLKTTTTKPKSLALPIKIQAFNNIASAESLQSNSGMVAMYSWFSAIIVLPKTKEKNYTIQVIGANSDKQEYRQTYKFYINILVYTHSLLPICTRIFTLTREIIWCALFDNLLSL